MKPLNNTKLLKSQGYINGEWIDSYQSETFDVTNPANHQLLVSVANMGQKETKDAIDIAGKTFEKWQYSLAKERYALLMEWYRLIIQNQQDLATLMVQEQGKPYAEALGEVAYSANFVQWFAEQAKRLNGVVKSGYIDNTDIQYTKEPVGVVGIITPWNFPLAMITRKVAPALAAGCTVIIKPPAETPLSALALVALTEEAGFPKGAINVIPTTKSAEVGQVLTLSKKVNKISFTGSTAVGKILMSECATNIKRTSMELGGNAPFIIFSDADLDIAINSLVGSKFRNAGQTCICPNRIYVHKTVYAEVLDKLLQRVKKFKLGNGLEEGITMGPLINQKAIEKVENHIAQSVSNGANVVTGGKKHSLGFNFFEPTILSEVRADSIFSCEETFGPIAPLIAFEEEGEVIEWANDSDFGLASYFCTQDYRRIHRVNRAIKSGIVAINEGVFSNEFGPFGGVKQSGIGREGSELGIDEYVDIKYSITSYK